MAKTVLSSVASVSALITAVLNQIVADGWVQVGATSIYKTSADSEGRVLYLELYEDAVGNFMVDAAPELDGTGLALSTVNDAIESRGCNFSSGDWHLYSSDKMFFLVKGTTNNSQRVFVGRYIPLSGTGIISVPFTGFICGCRRKDSATAYTNYLIGKGNNEDFRVCILHNVFWPPAHLTFLTQTHDDEGTMEWKLDTGFVDGVLCCGVVLICAYGTSTNHRSEREGICGILPDVICVSKDVDLVPGDTVTLPSGNQYEFREHTLYWDEYLEYFLLWRLN